MFAANNLCHGVAQAHITVSGFHFSQICQETEPFIFKSFLLTHWYESMVSRQFCVLRNVECSNHYTIRNWGDTCLFLSSLFLSHERHYLPLNVLLRTVKLLNQGAYTSWDHSNEEWRAKERRINTKNKLRREIRKRHTKL